MIKNGKGGSKTLTGLEFEKRIDLRTAFNSIPDYQVKSNELFYKGRLVARFYKKYEIYSKLLKSLHVNWDLRISKKLLPDESIFVLSNRTLFIIEMKFQVVSGSVDEKLQTCDFKKKEYVKLFSKTGISIEYLYILNDWFRKNEYRDVLNYIKSVGCKYFFEFLPLKELELPES